MSDTPTVVASCHCGAMAIEAQLDPKSEPALSCNCSICRRTGALLRFVPKSATTVKSEGDPTDYQFNTKQIHHLFCSTCGVRPWGYGTGPDGTEMVAINLRCVEDLDLDEVETKAFDGASM